MILNLSKSCKDSIQDLPLLNILLHLFGHALSLSVFFFLSLSASLLPHIHMYIWEYSKKLVEDEIERIILVQTKILNSCIWGILKNFMEIYMQKTCMDLIVMALLIFRGYNSSSYFYVFSNRSIWSTQSLFK